MSLTLALEMLSSSPKRTRNVALGLGTETTLVLYFQSLTFLSVSEVNSGALECLMFFIVGGLQLVGNYTIAVYN